jgi:hypothetical protein
MERDLENAVGLGWIAFGSRAKTANCKGGVKRRMSVVHGRNISQYFRAFPQKGTSQNFHKSQMNS